MTVTTRVVVNERQTTWFVEWIGDDEVCVSVHETYTGEHPDCVTTGVFLSVLNEAGEEVANVPITRGDLRSLGLAMLNAAECGEFPADG